MSNEHAEIPEPRVARESLGPVSALNRNLYLGVICILGFVLVVGVVGWVTLALNNKTMPDGLGVILGTAAGGLVGLISDKSK
jgi:hypothetical protein